MSALREKKSENVLLGTQRAQLLSMLFIINIYCINPLQRQYLNSIKYEPTKHTFSQFGLASLGQNS